MNDLPPSMMAFVTIIVLAFLAVVVARCTHQPNNENGFTVQSTTTYNTWRSSYEILEPGTLGSRITIYDSTGKFRVGDTLTLQLKP